VLGFAQQAMAEAGIDVAITTNNSLKRPIDINKLQGDYTKINTWLSWAPKTKFNDLVKLMVKADLKRWQDWQDGKTFPWDAYLYPNEARILRRCSK